MSSVLASIIVKAATSQKGLALDLFVPRNPLRVEDVVRARLSVLLVTTLVVVLASFQAPAAWAYPRGDQEDPNEDSKHEINELQKGDSFEVSARLMSSILSRFEKATCGQLGE